MYQPINKEKYIETLQTLSEAALHAVAGDIRAQEKIGLIHSKEAHDRLNCVSVVIMTKQIKRMEEENVT